MISVSASPRTNWPAAPSTTTTSSTQSAQANDELPGLSAFYKDEAGNVYHTYSTYARGLEDLIGTFLILDRAPNGRNESGPMEWVRRHDEYGDAPKANACYEG